MVSCDGVDQPAKAVVAARSAVSSPRGLVVLLSGELGTDWWASGGLSVDLLAQLAQDHLATVQVRWTDGWLMAATGEQAGPASLACRPATLIQWIHDVQYAPLGVSGSRFGSCGFCVTGNSGGASAALYAATLYPVVGIDAVVASSGPPHAALARGCLREAGDEPYWYEDSAALIVDRSYGFPDGGPCRAHDSSFAGVWERDQVDSRSAHSAAAERVHVILGLLDTTSAPTHADAYLQWSNDSSEQVPGMGHTIQQSADGLKALRDALTQ